MKLIKYYFFLLCCWIPSAHAVLIKNTIPVNLVLDIGMGAAVTRVIVPANKIIDKPLPEGNYIISVREQAKAEKPISFEKHLKTDDILLIAFPSQPSEQRYELTVQSKKAEERAKPSAPIQQVAHELANYKRQLDGIEPRIDELSDLEKVFELHGYLAAMRAGLLQSRNNIMGSLNNYKPASADYKALVEASHFTKSLIDRAAQVDLKVDNHFVNLIDAQKGDYQDVLNRINAAAQQGKLPLDVSTIINKHVLTINTLLDFLTSILIYSNSDYQELEDRWIADLERYKSNSFFKRYGSAKTVLKNVYPIVQKLTGTPIDVNAPLETAIEASDELEEMIAGRKIVDGDFEFIAYLAKFLQPASWAAYNAYLTGAKAVGYMAFPKQYNVRLKEEYATLRELRNNLLKLGSVTEEKKVSDADLMQALGVAKLPATPEQLLHVRKGAEINEINDAFLDLKEFWEHESNKDLARAVATLISDAYGKLAPAAERKHRAKGYPIDPAVIFTNYNNIFSNDLKRFQTLYKVDPVLFKTQYRFPERVDAIKTSIKQYLTGIGVSEEYSIPYWIQQYPTNSRIADIEIRFKTLLQEFEKLSA